MQGFVYSKPLAEREFGDWFAAWAPAALREAVKA
jgi:hypothetical protein